MQASIKASPNWMDTCIDPMRELAAGVRDQLIIYVYEPCTHVPCVSFFFLSQTAILCIHVRVVSHFPVVYEAAKPQVDHGK